MHTFLKPAVLIVDDDKDIREILASLIEDEGYPVMQASNGREGLEMARQGVGLILLDVEMPEMDGLRLCNALQLDPETTKIPVIFLSGWDDKLVRNLALEAGAYDYMVKPACVSELHVKLDAVSRFSGSANRPNARRCFAQTVNRLEKAYQVNEAASEREWFTLTA
ncbi:MAG: response regulator [Planctomycetes bacterium]|nr:response regulator [Planctomycetota bacterium]